MSRHARVTQTTTHYFLGGFKGLRAGGDVRLGPPTKEKDGDKQVPLTALAAAGRRRPPRQLDGLRL